LIGQLQNVMFIVKYYHWFNWGFFSFTYTRLLWGPGDDWNFSQNWGFELKIHTKTQKKN